ncbi:MAG: hypothetical protein NTX50_14120 [Candidatus Sumerlaeota bacterium]|nr:hypothetical protein [Candidatus Sumerlaeota bacterium]
MKRICTYHEMQDRFPDEWVLVGNPETDASLQVVSGTLLFHSKNRDELYRKARKLSPRECAILYFGAIPDDMVVVL